MAEPAPRWRSLAPAPDWVIPLYLREPPWYELAPLIGWALIDRDADWGSGGTIAEAVFVEPDGGGSITDSEFHHLKREHPLPGEYYVGCGQPTRRDCVTEVDRETWAETAQRHARQHRKRVERFEAAAAAGLVPADDAAGGGDGG